MMSRGVMECFFNKWPCRSSSPTSDQLADSEEGNVSELDADDSDNNDNDEDEDDEESTDSHTSTMLSRQATPEVDVTCPDGPTWVTVDNGQGGIQHIKMAHPPEAQFDPDLAALTKVDAGTASSENNNQAGKAATTPKDGPQTNLIHTTSSPNSQSGAISRLMKQELRGKNPFQFLIEPHATASAEKLRKRLVSKKGVVHISKSRMGKRQRTKYLRDFFNTMLDLRWRYVLLLFCLSFFLSWLGFACIWYIILYFRGDFEPGHLPDEQEQNNWKPCVYAIHNFASCFLFSVETQHTIGYGSRQTTERCPEAIVVMSFQSVVGVIIQACMVGTVFAKLTRPKKRAETLLFSRNAVICKRDGYLCLCFRVANMRSSHLVECHTRAILVSKKITDEGEIIPFHQTELKVGTDLEGEEDTILFIWPQTIVHRIDHESPFYNMSPQDFLKKRFEIIVVLEGIVEPTGMSIQARTSFLPNEILWGHRFVNVLNYRRREGQGEYAIDYGAFNSLSRVEASPICSGKCVVENPDLDHAAEGHQPTRRNHKISSAMRTTSSKTSHTGWLQPAARGNISHSTPVIML